MPNNRPYCLTIAGFDPSGGAGVIADVKTFEQNKCQGLSVITANTIQTEDSYAKTNWIPKDIILQQLTVLLNRYKVNFFKIGLIESSDVLGNIMSTIHEHCDKPTIVWDPVLSATSGGDFNENRFSEFLSALEYNNLIITPNLYEYRNLKLESSESIVYLKGGHSVDKGHDILYWNKKEYPFSPKISTQLKKHGTGCLFSSALLANLSRSYPIIKSCLRAKRYVEKRIVSNPSLLAYHK